MNSKWIHDYFSFSKKERNAVLVLVVLIITVSILPYILPPLKTPCRSGSLREFQEEVAMLKPVRTDSFHNYRYEKPPGYYRPGRYAATPSAPRMLFYFDPNTLTPESWKRLGLEDRTIQTIMRYIAKGGRFRKPEDIGKIYSLKQQEVEDCFLTCG